MNKKYYLSIIILFIGIFTVKSELTLEECFGIMESFFFIARWVLIIGVLIFSTLIWFIEKDGTKYNYLPLICTILIFITSAIANWTSNYQLNRKNILFATITCENDPMRSEIALKENGNYYIELHNLEWTCRYSGNYKILTDTLFLDKSIILQSDSVFNDKYVLSEEKKYLVPIINNTLISDTTKWLIVEKQ